MTQSNVSVSNPSSSSFEAPGAHDAYASLAEEIAAVKDAELVHINVDIPVAVTTALRVIGGIQALRPQFDASLRDFDFRHLEKLDAYARAAFHAHSRYVVSSRPVEVLPELLADATRLRDLLYSDGLALANRGVVNGDFLRSVRVDTAHRSIAVELDGLATFFEENWAQVQGKSALTLEDVQQARALSARLLDAVSQREVQPSRLAANTLARQRAYSLFFRAYDQLRRAVSYVRWEAGDLEQVAPSLYLGRGGRRKAESEAPTTPTPGIPPASDPQLEPGTASPPSLGGQPIVPIQPLGHPGGEALTRS